ncbi:hypothetical protein EPN52_13545 [bacterium]|nr:MAG: hypothetical protein EPN52_13545 [bacterium]
MRSFSPVLLRLAGALILLPAVVAAARFGLAWQAAPSPPPSVHAAARAASTPAALAVVYVAGAVARPGLVSLPAGARVAVAVARAVPLAQSDLVAVNLAARVADGEEIVVPVRGAVASRVPGATARVSHRRVARPSAPPAQPLSLNAADAQALAAVPGIGARTAARIVAYRETYGPFAAVDDLLDVAGITERSLARAAPYLRP